MSATQPSNAAVYKNQQGLQPQYWVDRYSYLLFHFLHLRTRDKTTAEDLLQETFLSAWRSRETYNKTASEKNWLFTICRNKLIDYFRSLKIHNNIRLVDHYFDEADHWTQAAAPGAWSFEDLPLVTSEFYKVLDECRRKLKPAQYSAFALKYMDGMNAKEICELMKISMQNYWVLIHRSKLQLRECLQINWVNL